MRCSAQNTESTPSSICTLSRAARTPIGACCAFWGGEFGGREPGAGLTQPRHSDNNTNSADFWDHKDFQDRVVWLWEQLAEHYKDYACIAGYNPLNEPCDPSECLYKHLQGPPPPQLTRATRTYPASGVLRARREGDPRSRSEPHPLVGREHVCDGFQGLQKHAAELCLCAP